MSPKVKSLVFGIVSSIITMCVALFALSFVIIQPPAAQCQETHRHHINELRLKAVKIIDVKNAKLAFVDLEEDNIKNMVVTLHEVEVDREFRFINLKENKDGNGSYEILGLGALKNSIGILSICSGCKKAVGFRAGKIDFFGGKNP